MGPWIASTVRPKRGALLAFLLHFRFNCYPSPTWIKNEQNPHGLGNSRCPARVHVSYDDNPQLATVSILSMFKPFVHCSTKCTQLILHAGYVDIFWCRLKYCAPLDIDQIWCIDRITRDHGSVKRTPYCEEKPEGEPSRRLNVLS